MRALQKVGLLSELKYYFDLDSNIICICCYFCLFKNDDQLLDLGQHYSVAMYLL